MEVLREVPKPSSFVPLVEHQSATPASFYEGPPVLHYYSDRCKLIILEQEASTSPALANLVSKAPATTPAASDSNGNHVNGSDRDDDSRKVIEEIDVWVTSDKLFIFSTPLNTGISISYPSISLHAIQSSPEPTPTDTSSQALYMQLISSPTGNSTQSEDTEPESISLTIIPTASGVPTTTSSAQADTVDAELQTESIPEQTPVAAMFTALSNCSNLHPDPDDDEDEMDQDVEDGLQGSGLYQSGMVMPGGSSGGLPPPMPGSGGWITAENMHEFLDAEGNWIGQEDDGGEEMEEDGPEGLGPGAGITRPRAGDGEDGEDETKWRRTD